MGGTQSCRVAITTVLASQPALAACLSTVPALTQHGAVFRRATTVVAAHRRFALTTMAGTQPPPKQSQSLGADHDGEQLRVHARTSEKAHTSIRKQNLYGLRDEQLASVLEDWGEKKFRLKQIKSFIYGDAPAECGMAAR